MPSLESVALPRIFTLLNGEVLPRCQEIEIASSFQIPHFQVIGLPGPEVSEAKDRIRAAIESSDLEFPKRKIVLNLSPASVRKNGTGLDLGMAIAVLLEGKRLEGKTALPPFLRIFAWAELGLNGQVKSVKSPVRALAASLVARAEVIVIAREDERLFRNEAERLFSDESLPRIIAISHLRELLPKLDEPSGAESVEPPLPPPPETISATAPLLPVSPSLSRLLEVASAGAHHFLLLGPKGVGKSHALEWFLRLQPELDFETLRTRGFLSEISGKSVDSPFRRVSTQSKAAALIGSFSNGTLRPGEFSLAHGGVLIADEFPEWSRDAREALRDPLERKHVSLTRVDGSVDLPADFIFAGNGNLCPCGGAPSSPSDSRLPACRCIPAERSRYLARLSGPILDRLDLVFPVLNPPGKSEANVRFEEARDRVILARIRLIHRFGKLPGKLSPEELESFLSITPSVRDALNEMGFGSFRDRHKTLRVALTLAALHGSAPVDSETLLEARMLRLQSESILR